jgi:hypothetical protein
VYELQRLNLIDGRHAWAYVCNPEAEVGPNNWSAEDLEQQHLPAYIDRCAT